MSKLGQILTLLLLLVSIDTLASENTSVVEVQTEKSPWGLGLTLETATNRISASEADHSAEMNFYVEPTYKIDADTTIAGFFSATKELTGERNTNVGDALLIGYFKKFTLNPYLKFQPVAQILLPLSDSSRLENSQITGLYAAGRIHFNLKPIRIDNLSGFYELRVNRNIHTFDTTISGDSNTRDSIRNRFAVSWAFLPRFNFANDFRFYHSWTYQGNLKLAFELINEVSFSASEAVTVGLGHRNSGNAMKANGIDSNIGIISDKGSQFYGYLNYGF